MDLALLIVRVVGGLLLAGHGAQKLFGWFGGRGLTPMAGWAASMGLRPPAFWAVLAGLAECGGGLLLVLGLFSPLGALGAAAAMLVAITKAHWPKVWAANGGFELALLYLAIALAVGVGGPGRYSLDAVFHTALPAAVSLVGAAAVLVGWLVVLFTPRPAATQTGGGR